MSFVETQVAWMSLLLPVICDWCTITVNKHYYILYWFVLRFKNSECINLLSKYQQPVYKKTQLIRRMVIFMEMKLKLVMDMEVDKVADEVADMEID